MKDIIKYTIRPKYMYALKRKVFDIF